MKKLQLELIPTELIRGVGEVLTFGADKYSPRGWDDVDKAKYIGSMLRHTLSYLEDNKSLDSESGYSHLKHLACNVAILLSKEEELK